MPIDLIAIAFDQLLELAKEKGKRNDKILKVLDAIGVKQDAPLDKGFDGVYAYTLVVYGIEKPKPVLEFFRHEFIKTAFQKSFEQRDLSILEKETENFLNWNEIGKGLAQLDYDPRQEFSEFQEQFITAAKLTRTAQEVLVDQKLDDISYKLGGLPTRKEFESLIDVVQHSRQSFSTNITIESNMGGNTVVDDNNKTSDEVLSFNEALENILEDIQGIPKRDDLHAEFESFILKVETLATEGIVKNVYAPPFILAQLDIINFTGRESEIKRIEKQLLHNEVSSFSKIVGITGTGGMGKSTLAFHFANDHRENFPDGIIGMRVDGAPVDVIAQKFASHAGVETSTYEQKKASEIMQSIFRNKKALLIFDNAEEISVRDLRPGGRLCAVIVTTRNAGILRALDIPPLAQIDLQSFSLIEAEKFLVSLIGEEKVLREKKEVERIWKLVGGLPLALKIIGGALVDQNYTSVTDYVSMLYDEKNLLSVLQDPDDETLNARASFFLSYKKLTTLQKHIFMCLGVCAPEGFSLETICATSAKTHGEVRDSLARLIRLSLLEEDSQKEHFVLHPLLHLFASELAHENGVYEEAEERHTEYFKDYVVKNSGYEQNKLNALERELDGLILTAKRLMSQRIIDYSFYLYLEPFFQSRGYTDEETKSEAGYRITDLLMSNIEIARENQDWHSRIQMLIQLANYMQSAEKFKDAELYLLEAESNINNINEAQEKSYFQGVLLNSLDGLYRRQGRFDEAIKVLKRHAVIEELLDNKQGQVAVLNSLGVLLQRQGKFNEASTSFQHSLEILEKLGDNHGLAMVLNSLGSVFQRQGRFDEAVNTFQRSFEISERIGDDRSLTMVLSSLGGVLQRQGKFDEAVNAFQRSFEISEKLGDNRSLSMALISLGGVLQRQGRFDEAVDAFQRGFEISEKLGDTRSLSIVLNSLGGVLQRQGKFDEAVDAFQRSFEISQKLGDDRSIAMVLNSLGGVLQRQGRFDEAVDAFQRSFEISQKLGDDRSVAMVLNSLGGVLQRQGKFDEAVDAFQRSLEISQKLGDDRSIAMVLNSLGGVLQRQGKFDRAADVFRHSFEISQRLGDDRSYAMVLNSLGGVLQRQSNFDEAIDAFQRSYELLVKLGDDRGQAMVLNSLGGVFAKQKKYQESEEVLKKSIGIGIKLKDSSHLSKVHTVLGKSLLEQNKLQDALSELQKGFEIDESLHNDAGIRIVTPSLIRVLSALELNDKAKEYAKRALAIAPDDKRLLRLMEQLSTIGIKSGHIKKIIRNLSGYLYGFIATEDTNDDIYFGQDQVDEEVIPKLAEGISVWVEVELAARGPRARRVWLKD